MPGNLDEVPKSHVYRVVYGVQAFGNHKLVQEKPPTSLSVGLTEGIWGREIPKHPFQPPRPVAILGNFMKFRANILSQLIPYRVLS